MRLDKQINPFVYLEYKLWVGRSNTPTWGGYETDIVAAIRPTSINWTGFEYSHPHRLHNPKTTAIHDLWYQLVGTLKVFNHFQSFRFGMH